VPRAGVAVSKSGEAYERFRAAPQVRDHGIAVSLQFCGELASILALGVEPNGPVGSPGHVGVIVKYRDLPRVVKHSHVLFLSAGRAKSYQPHRRDR
jgi:hypothetical protein